MRPIEIHLPPHNYSTLVLIRDTRQLRSALDNEPECRALMLCSEWANHFARARTLPIATPKAAERRARPGENPPRRGVLIVLDAKPVVAAIQVSGNWRGLGLAPVADFRVTADARFAANFVKIGIHPGFGPLTYTLPRLTRRAAVQPDVPHGPPD